MSTTDAQVTEEQPPTVAQAHEEMSEEKKQIGVMIEHVASPTGTNGVTTPSAASVTLAAQITPTSAASTTPSAVSTPSSEAKVLRERSDGPEKSPPITSMQGRGKRNTGVKRIDTKRSNSNADQHNPLLNGTGGPHGPAPMTPSVPIPLSHPWSWYLDDTNLWGVTSVAECLAKMGYLGTVDSIQGFWTYYNSFEKKLLTEKKLGVGSCQGSMQDNGYSPGPSPTNNSGGGGVGKYNWRIFDSLITPVWEDESHKDGGKFVLRCGHGLLRATKFIWTKIVLSMVGAAFIHQDVICGCVLACRPHKKEIQLWVKHLPPKLPKPTPATPQITASNENTDGENGHENGAASMPASAAATTSSSSSSNTSSRPDSPVAGASTTASTSTSNAVSPVNASSSSSSSSASTVSTTAAPSAPVIPTHSVCTCHQDPALCFANDLRFLLGVLGLTPAVKIEYTPHSVTMGDVESRNKRLKQKISAKREERAAASAAGGAAAASAATGERKGSTAGTPAPGSKQEKYALEAARAERNAQRDREMAQAQQQKARSNSVNSNDAKKLFNFPVKKPSPITTSMMGSSANNTGITSTPSSNPASTPGSVQGSPRAFGNSSLSLPQGKHASKPSWGDESDSDRDDYDQPESELPSTVSSQRSSVASTPLVSPILNPRMLHLQGRQHLPKPILPATTGGNRSPLPPIEQNRDATNRPHIRSKSTTPQPQQMELLPPQQAMEQHLESRSFEGLPGDRDGRPSAAGRVQLPQPALMTSPAALRLMSLNQGATPLKLSGDIDYHPEPDSPGMNQTPCGTPLLTGMSMYSYAMSGDITPTPRSPFAAHSPLVGPRGSMSGKLVTTRMLASPLHSPASLEFSTYPHYPAHQQQHQARIEKMSSLSNSLRSSLSSSPAGSGDSSDIDEEHATGTAGVGIMTEFRVKNHSAASQHRQTLLELESLSLPPASQEQLDAKAKEMKSVSSSNVASTPPTLGEGVFGGTPPKSQQSSTATTVVPVSPLRAPMAVPASKQGTAVLSSLLASAASSATSGTPKKNELNESTKSAFGRSRQNSINVPVPTPSTPTVATPATPATPASPRTPVVESSVSSLTVDDARGGILVEADDDEEQAEETTAELTAPVTEPPSLATPAVPVATAESVLTTDKIPSAATTVAASPSQPSSQPASRKGSRKKKSLNSSPQPSNGSAAPSPQQQTSSLQQKKRGAKSKQLTASETASLTSSSRAYTKKVTPTRTYIIYGLVALFTLIMIYLLFFTTIAPEEVVVRPRVIVEKTPKASK